MGLSIGTERQTEESIQSKINSSSFPSGEAQTTTPVVSVKPRLKKKWRPFALGLLYMSPAIIILSAFSYFPFFRAIWLSFFVTNATGEPTRFNDVQYYSRILNLDGSGRDEYLKSIWTTVLFSLMSVPPGICVAVALAVLATVKVRMIGVFRTIFTSSIAISVASAAVIWGLIYSPSTRATQWVIDLFNLKTTSLLTDASSALLAVAFMTVWTALGFNFIIALSGIQAIPQDLYESSSLDGATGLTAFRYITLPLLTPTLLFLFIISTIQSFQAFTQFNILVNGEGPNGATNVFVVAAFKAFWADNRFGFASAMSVVLFAIILFLTLVQFRLLDRKVHYQ